MRDIDRLHPSVRIKARALLKICAEEGLSVVITQTYRTKDEQDAIYAQGRTAPGKIVSWAQWPNSMHAWGLAFDVAKNIKGREFDDSDGFFAKVGQIGKDIGLVWGGDWLPPKEDKPHFEDRTVAGALSDVIKQYETPHNFTKSWSGL